MTMAQMENYLAGDDNEGGMALNLGISDTISQRSVAKSVQNNNVATARNVLQATSAAMNLTSNTVNSPRKQEAKAKVGTLMDNFQLEDDEDDVL